MTFRLLFIFSCLSVAGLAMGQDAPQAPPADTASEAPDVAQPTDDVLGEPDELDDQEYEQQDEDIFIPSEEIPLDQDIPFPTDI